MNFHVFSRSRLRYSGALLAVAITFIPCVSLVAQAAPAEGELELTEQELQAKEELLLKQLGAQISHEEKLAETAPTQPKVIVARALDAKASTAQPAELVPVAPTNEQIIADLEKRLTEKEARIEGLVQDIQQTRNRLLLAETEVERLSAIIQERNRKQISSFHPETRQPEPKAATKAPARVVRNASVPAPAPVIESDMQVATVTSEKANLRTGPGANNSPIMTVSRGTRLAVETRSGEWYRVISPAGTRAWVSSDVVVFGEPAGVARQARMGGYDSKAEDRAFDFINRKP